MFWSDPVKCLAKEENQYPIQGYPAGYYSCCRNHSDKISIKDKAAFPFGMFVFPIYFFYGTVVIALATMLLNVIVGNKIKKEEFNVSNYLLFVIISGLIIGSGLLFASSIAF